MRVINGMKKIKNISIIVLSSLFLFKARGAYATTIGLQNPLNVGSIPDLIYAVLDWFVLAVGPAVAVIMIIYGAFNILTAGGDPKKFELGKKSILYAVVGYGIILIAEGVVLIVQKLLQ